MLVILIDLDRGINTPYTAIDTSVSCARKEEKKGLYSQAELSEVIKPYCSSAHGRNTAQLFPLSVTFQRPWFNGKQVLLI